MGIKKAFGDALSSTFADQWRDIFTAVEFDEHTVLVPGVMKNYNSGRGSNDKGSEGVITSGSKILIPENTAAIIFSQEGIEEIITTPGEHIYSNGEGTAFSGEKIAENLFNTFLERVEFAGIPSVQKRIAYVNLREIRNIKFGTKGPLIYNDKFYETDLEIRTYGVFSIKVIDPEKFIRNFVPPNISYYTFDEPKVREQLLSEFLQSLIVNIGLLSKEHRISELPAFANEIASNIVKDNQNAGTWEERYGFVLTNIGIENIQFSEESKQLVNQYSSNKMNIKAYENISKATSNIAAQQKIAEGIKDFGLGEGGAMVFGMNYVQGITQDAQVKQTLSFDEQIEMLKKLKSLVDEGIITQEEFNKKKKEIMDL